MISKSAVLIAILGLAAGYGIRDDATALSYRNKRDVPYHGPPAPLNHDGTVAFTAEIQQANNYHNAAYAEEYQRLQAAEALAAAHPDRTSPPSKDYNSLKNGQYNQQQYDNGQLGSQQDDGQYRPHLYETKQSNQHYSSNAYESFKPQVSYNQEISYDQKNYNSLPYSSAPQNQISHLPAPLNPDGTVAHTPEYNALAATLHNSYQHALVRHRRSLNHYHGPPAPLNHDGTVAFTAEFQQANNIHNAAYAEEYQRLQAAEALAAAHPDRTSPPSMDYNPQKNGQYNQQQYDNGQQDDGQYRPHLYETEQPNQHYSSNAYGSFKPQVSYHQEINYDQKHYNSLRPHSATPQNPIAHIPAPLNPDGTVAHTPEYNALAATLQNSYQQTLTRHRRSLNHYRGPPAPLNHDGTVANTPDIEHAIAVHKAAYAQEYQKLLKAEGLAGAHLDLTYSKHDEISQDGGYSHQQYNNHQEDDGQYRPHLYENGDYISHQEEDDYNQNEYSTSHYGQEPVKYNPEAHIPAPLNHDGTVAHTANYKAVAAAHQAEYEKALHSVKHQSISPHSSYGRSIW